MPVEPVDSRKQHRHTRREQLYIAIREAMTVAGVLSTGYKFKVLSLDQIGDEFLVMVDLAPCFAAGFDRLSAIEKSVVDNARRRFEIEVPTVYWRHTGSAGCALPLTAVESGTNGDLPAARRAPVPGADDGVALAARQAIGDDEVAAFNRALLAASSKSQPAALERSVKPGHPSLAQRPPRDFADTELVDSTPVQALGKTQYGELR